ncbi:uncharacterized protein [Drosophila takahashii]|uniref:uncharacterized protein n=1 Tax=Drosophila takahashii TaxID=29030 RepID=UPI003898F7F3
MSQQNIHTNIWGGRDVTSALEVVQSFQATDDNYKKAVECLSDCIYSLFAMPTVKHPDSTALQRLITKPKKKYDEWQYYEKLATWNDCCTIVNRRLLFLDGHRALDHRPPQKTKH